MRQSHRPIPSRPGVRSLSLLALVASGPSFAANDVPVCHKGKQIAVNDHAVAAHLGHGDTLPGTWFLDTDADGYGDPDAAAVACSPPPGTVADDTDCDPDDPAVHPGALEVCNTLDDDCDGTADGADAADATAWFGDADEDGFGSSAVVELACEAPVGTSDNDADCDDGDPSVNPNAAETCSPVDDDCDGQVNEPDAIDAGTWYPDDDGDAHGDGALPVSACEAPPGASPLGDDCDDLDPTRYPGAIELCDAVDEDCDGAVDENAADSPPWYADGDHDGFGSASTSTLACEPPPGHVADSRDCDDVDPTIHPGAAERCDLSDNDCDAVTDEPDAIDALTWYLDADDDTYGLDTDTARACTQPLDYAARGGDCDDAHAAVAPDVVETCGDGVDQDCSGSDLACPDVDGDGWTVAEGDCDDTDDEVYPGAAEDCDGEDDDCDGNADEGAPGGFFSSTDGPDLEVWGDTSPVTAYGIRVFGGMDFDDDGYDDFVVGGYGGTQPIDVYHGGPGGVSGVRDLRLLPDPTVRHFGQSISGGDLNDDGYDDLVVGAADQAHTLGGAARVYLGSAIGLSSTHAWEVRGADLAAEFGQSVGVIDVDRDGYGDVIVGARNQLCVFPGTATVPSTTGQCSPQWASEIQVGDFDDDGYGDVVYFQMVYPSTYLGSFVRYGSQNGLGAAQQLSTGLVRPGDQFSRALDYTNDGIDDLLLQGGGTLRLRRGTPTGLQAADAWTIPGGSGDAVGLAGDLDGDGYNDLAYGYSTATRVVMGSPTGLRASPEPLAFTAAGYFTKNLGPAGDVDGDGFDDLLVGEYQYSSERGHFYLFYGGGRGVCVDFDGDGFEDEATGGEDCDDSNPHVHPGALEVCDLVDNDCDGLTDEEGVCGPIDAGMFATSISGRSGELRTMPDMDGDQGDELAIGSSVFGAPFTTTAPIATFAGSPRPVGNVAGGAAPDHAWTESTFNGPVRVLSGVPAPRLQTYGVTDAFASFTAPPNQMFVTSIMGGGDVTGDGFEDLVIGMYTGLHLVPGPIAAGTQPLPAATVTEEGYSKYTTGPMDLDGDGVDDLVVSLGGCSITGCGFNGGATVAVIWGGDPSILTSRSLATIVTTGKGRVLFTRSGYQSQFTDVRNGFDTTGDGRDDLLVMDRATFTLRVLALESGREGPITQTTILGFPYVNSNAEIGPVARPIDLDGDETMDLVVSKAVASNVADGGVLYTFRARPPGSTTDLRIESPHELAVVAAASVPQFGKDLAVGDYDGDGLDDIATIDGDGTLYMMYPNR